MNEKIIDKDNMISVLRNFPEMVKEASFIGDDLTVQKEFIENIVVCGMGGSGFSGDMLKVYLKELKVEVIKDYDLPKYIQKKSLVFCVSYSGNTEETISAYRTAIRRGCKVITISSGGKLQDLAKMNNNPHLIVPRGIQPRLSIPYLFIPMLNILSYSGLIDDQEVLIKKLPNTLRAMLSSIENNSKELAKKVKGKVPIIYTTNELFCIAEKWKTDINENAKTHAFYNVFPEFNHNEICAYENQNMQSHVIIISDKETNPRMKDRIKIFKKIIGDVPVTEIGIAGDNLLTKLFTGVWAGLFFSYYLALEYNTNPTPVNIIERLKKELK